MLAKAPFPTISSDPKSTLANLGHEANDEVPVSFTLFNLTSVSSGQLAKAELPTYCTLLKSTKVTLLWENASSPIVYTLSSKSSV